MPDERTFRPNGPGIISEVLDGEAIVVNLESGAYYSLAGAGAIVWMAAESGLSHGDIMARVTAAYDGDPAVMAASVNDLLEQLLGEGLLVSVDTTGVRTLGEAGPAGASTPSSRQPFVGPALQKFTDMADLLLLDPIHQVGEEGWPHPAPGATGSR